MLKMGDRVKVNAPEDATASTIRKLNGCMFVVKRCSGYRNGTCYYELFEAVSDYGIPYAFVEDWLQKVEP